MINIDVDVLHAFEDMVRDGEGSFDELADHAFRDFLKKHRQPITLHDALRQSTQSMPANDQEQRKLR
jgi:hypothetical protein